MVNDKFICLSDLDNLNPLNLYKYGLYVNILAGINKGLSKREITKVYNNMPIKSKDEINIKAIEICEVLNKKPSAFLNKIYNDIENEILIGKLNNDKESITKYILKKYVKQEN